MPISQFQCEVLHTIAANRSPESYLAGATVLHRKEDSPRYSQDLDFFHDLAESIAQSSEADAQALVDAGYDVKWLLRAPTFSRLLVGKDDQRVRLEWAQDSAFRFFPVQEDEMCGYRLHDADAAINKMLAMAGRQEIRDFVDVLHLHNSYLSVGAMVWAACGKDPGFTPMFLIENAARHVAYTQNDLDRLNLENPMDLQQMKRMWLVAAAEAQALVEALPAEEIGCLYLEADDMPVNPTPGAASFQQLTRHYGCVSGSWPKVM